MAMSYYMPTKIIVGKGCIREYGKSLEKYGHKAMIVTGKSSAKRNGSLKDVEEVLNANQIEYVIFDEVEENPSLQTVERARDLALSKQVDFIIGIGGGSPLDASKAIGVLVKHPELVGDTLINGESLDSVPIIAVPTTAGTGSEVTQYAILTDHKAQTKKNIGHSIFPEIAFLDASYMMQMPVDITIHTAVDALSHLVESYLSTRSQALSEGLVEQGMKLWGECIEALLSQNFTFEVRQKLLLASMYGGMAIAQTGTSLPHGMGYALTYHKGIPHGLANGVLYNAYLRSFKNQYKVNCLHQLLGLKSHEALEGILEKLCKISISVTEEELKHYTEELCENQAKLANHPEKVTTEDIYKIYRESLLRK